MTPNAISLVWSSPWWYKQHAPLRPFMTKAWPHYRRMQGFMPGIQPRGTHAFDPSSHSATEMLNAVNAEEDGAEDQVSPLNLPMSNMPAAHATAESSPLANSDLGTASPRGTSSIVSSFSPPSNLNASSCLGGTGPLPSSSLPHQSIPKLCLHGIPFCSYLSQQFLISYDLFQTHNHCVRRHSSLLCVAEAKSV